MISHGGAMNGQLSLLAIFPEMECVVGVSTNSSSGGSLTCEQHK